MVDFVYIQTVCYLLWDALMDLAMHVLGGFKMGLVVSGAIAYSRLF